MSAIAELADASFSYNNLQGWDGAGRLDDVVALSRAVWRSRAIGDMWSYMLLAEGALDIVGEFDLQPYDMAALIPIVQEAGGTLHVRGRATRAVARQRTGHKRAAARRGAAPARAHVNGSRFVTASLPSTSEDLRYALGEPGSKSDHRERRVRP